ncbi:MAG: type II/IV secretion system ATPase subunit, partial [Nanoarchaeota archaeon]|nr:type II/IV secretion system ATPase subunit [Nanoarchaeota archaeon]
CGRSISVSEPLSEGALPEGSRVQATLGTDIARRGSNFTIRKFTSDPLTPMHLLASGTLNEKMLAYFWYAIENNASILISGPTASGKTSLLNALSLFIKPSLKIVTIEDTPELKLPHTHWVPEVSRQGVLGMGSKMVGEVSMFDLLKGSLRQRPDYIIVGEVRGDEAYVLFQQMASGHSGLSTIHADSIDKVVDRLTTPPINLPPMLLETLDFVIFVKHIRYRGRYVRRIMEVREIQKYDTKDKEIKTLRVFRWFPKTDKFDTDASSALLKKISLDTGITEEQVKAEINKRIKVIKWLKENKITDYRDVGRIIAAFYTNPDALLEELSEQ